MRQSDHRPRTNARFSLGPRNLPPVLNPLRSEREAFRFLIYVAVFFAVLAAIVLIARAL